MFGNPETTPGGRALKFYSSVRLDTRKIDNIKDGEKVICSRHRIKVVKNKVAPPFRQAEVDMMADEGISKEGGLLDVGLEFGIVTKSGAFLKWNGKILGQGRESAKSYLSEHQKEAKELEKQIREAAKKGEAVKPQAKKEEAVEESLEEVLATV